MRLRSPEGELSFTLLSTVPSQSPDEPDLRIEISAKVASFSASGSRAWIEWPDVTSFITELGKLVRDCKGSASVAAMSPTDFHLSVANVDSLGHFAVQFSIGSIVHSQAGIFPCSLSAGFEVELSQLEELLAWFKHAREPHNDA
jgi:hypothetical protein